MKFELPKQSLPYSFYLRSTTQVAKELVGKIIITDFGALRGGRIVEVEAYCGENDPASHAACGKTQRNGSMFGQVGVLYMYISYGLHHCCNIVARDHHSLAGGVLIRAIEPLVGIELMQQARGKTGYELTNGPGKVAQALGLYKKHDGISLLESAHISIKDDCFYKPELVTATRIGISKAQEKLWRFYDRKSNYVSKR